jgi:hypothetical protein
MNDRLGHGICECFLPKALLALDVVLWLLMLPIMLRMHTIPALLARVAARAKQKRNPMTELEEAVAIAVRICELQPFRSPFFPKPCLRRSLTLYRTLINMGYHIEIHFGVSKHDDKFTGHSWVTMKGKPVADTCTAIFTAVYTYPPRSRETHI